MKIRGQARILGAAALLSACSAHASAAQEQGPIAPASETEVAKEKASSETDTAPDANVMMRGSEGRRTGLVGRFMTDQKEIWTSPTRLRFPDAEWLVPLSGITAGLLVTDRDYSKRVSQNPTTISHYKTLSNAGVAALVGGASGMWVMGHVSHNEHWSETGFLAGEAALNSFVAVELFKYTLRRERPYQGDGSGAFLQSGGTSFPSEHAAAAWSVAGVIAHEYPGPFTKVMAYGLASLVSVSRLKAHQHFPSDVVVGSVIGNLVAQDIYSRHHDFELGGGEWRSISQLFRGDGNSSPGNGIPRRGRRSEWNREFPRASGILMLACDGHFRQAAHRRLSFRANNHQRLRPAIPGGIQLGRRLLWLDDVRSLGGLRAGRISALAFCTRAAGHSPANHCHSRWNTGDSTRHAVCGGEPLAVARCLRRAELRELASHLRQAESVVGSGRRRAHDVQRRRGIHQHVPHQSDLAASATKHSEVSGPGSDGIFHRQTRRPPLCSWPRPPHSHRLLVTTIESPTVHGRRE